MLSSASPDASKGDLHALGPGTADLGKLSLLVLYSGDGGFLRIEAGFRTHCHGGDEALSEPHCCCIYRASQRESRTGKLNAILD
jgi:hypothetical protein